MPKRRWRRLLWFLSHKVACSQKISFLRLHFVVERERLQREEDGLAHVQQIWPVLFRPLFTSTRTAMSRRGSPDTWSGTRTCPCRPHWLIKRNSESQSAYYR